MTNTLDQTGLGSTDANGGKGPAGGTHTGTAVIRMNDGTTFSVASNKAEVRRKLDAHAVAPTTPIWVCFDVPNSSVPIVINSASVSTVT